LGALGVRALRRLAERLLLLLAFGVLDLRLVDAREADLDRDALGVLERRFVARRFAALLGFSSPSVVFLGALGVLALRRLTDRLLLALGVLERRLEADLNLDALGVLERRLVARRFLDFLGFSSPSTATGFLGALGVLALRRLEERLLLAFGVLDLRLVARRLDFLGFSSPSTALAFALDLFGALGVLALRRLDDLRLLALGVLDRREDRLREALGVLDRRLVARRFLAFLGFSSPSAAAFGAFGVRARRRLTDLLLLALGVLDLRLDADREAERDFEALGVLERLFEARRRLADRDFEELGSLDLGAFGVRARRRLADRLLLLLALGVLDLRLAARRFFDLFGFSSPSAVVFFLGALGAFARRLEALRFLDALGSLLLRRRPALRDLFGALGVRALRRLAERLFLAFGVRLLRLDFLRDRLGAFGVAGPAATGSSATGPSATLAGLAFFLVPCTLFLFERARFFRIPSSLFLLSSMFFLYWSRSVDHLM